MSNVIKSDRTAGLSIQPLRNMHSLAPVPKAPSTQDRLLSRVAELESEKLADEAELLGLRLEVERVRDLGLAEGRLIGLSEAQDNDKERLDFLRTNLDNLHATLKTGLSWLETIAAAMARECLDKILGDPEYQAQLVTRCLETQMRNIEKNAILEITVSKSDFSDDDSLATISEIAPSAALVASQDMQSGGCTLRFKLGRMDVGVSQQWAAMRDVLNEIVFEDSSSS